MFRAVVVYDLDGNFIGYTIQKDPSVLKLQTVNIWTESETGDLQAQLSRLNDQKSVLAHWPRYDDPQVQAILADETFMPPEYENAEVVDEDKSLIVWDQEPSDELPFGRMNEEASVIVTKTIKAPTPASMQARTKKAQEIVARQRGG